MNASWKETAQSLGILCLLVLFYTMTRPLNHAESYDSINYVLFADNFPLGEAPDSRNILFHAINRMVVIGADTCGLEVGTLELLAAISILAGAASLVLFARMLRRRFEVSSFSAWAGAAFLGLTYGYWRYTGAVEVYIPSIFLILCSLELIFKFLDGEQQSQKWVIAAGALSGLAVLFYQPNLIALFVAASVLFCTRALFVSFITYSTTGAIVVLSGLVAAYMSIEGSFPSPHQLVDFITDRNGEFREAPEFGIALVKFVLAFGHDVFSAHWTRTIDPVRNTLDPITPGCIYNFNVVSFAGKGIQHFTAIAAILFLPMLLMFTRLHWIASKRWQISRPQRRTVFMVAWLLCMGLIVGTIDPGSFEAWIPLLVPFSVLLTLFVIEPCWQAGKQKTVLTFLLMLLAYNFFGGMMIWRNTAGDHFLNKTAWVRNELGEGDTFLLNEFDFRMVDYLRYYSSARIVHLYGDDEVTIFRSHPDIHSVPLDDFLNGCKNGDFRLFVGDDVLSPDPDIKQCRSGEVKFAAAMKLADRLKDHATLVNSSDDGDVYQIRFDD